MVFWNLPQTVELVVTWFLMKPWPNRELILRLFGLSLVHRMSLSVFTFQMPIIFCFPVALMFDRFGRMLRTACLLWMPGELPFYVKKGGKMFVDCDEGPRFMLREFMSMFHFSLKSSISFLACLHLLNLLMPFQTWMRIRCSSPMLSMLLKDMVVSLLSMILQSLLTLQLRFQVKLQRVGVSHYQKNIV